jgi:DNA (cytosine-5)-methyltransferase 1
MSGQRVLDLFCGCGGMSWGLKKAGFDISAGIDCDVTALQTFQLNHPEAKTLCKDLATYTPEQLMIDLKIQPEELDGIVGGPPCQGFSKNVPASIRFLSDPRNQLMYDFLRFVAVLKPRVVLMENVAEIYNAYHGQVRDEIETFLNAVGYQVTVKNLYAPDYGVPQRRRRCFFLAYRGTKKLDFPLPSHTETGHRDLFSTQLPYWSAWDAISDLPQLHNGEGSEPMLYDQPPNNTYQKNMRQSASILYDHITRKLRPRQFERVTSLKAGEGIKDLPEHLRPKAGYSGAYGRLDFTTLAPTITRWIFHPGSGRFCHPREDRLITIREAARLQSFSDDFRFTGTYIQKAHQVGNAVPPLLTQALAPALLNGLDVATTFEALPPLANVLVQE